MAYSRRLGMVFAVLLALMSANSVYDRYHDVTDVAGGLLVGRAAIALEPLVSRCERRQ